MFTEVDAASCDRKCSRFAFRFLRSLSNTDGTLYFSADNGTGGHELWKSDGTEDGTVLVKDIWRGKDSSYPSHLINANGALYFSANDGTNGWEMWTSDGTEAGTVLVADLARGPGGSSPHRYSVAKGKLFFSADDGLHGMELWSLDVSFDDDFNSDGKVDVTDLDLLCSSRLSGGATRGEIEGFWSRRNTGPGDANFDHRFDSSDLTAVFQRGKYGSGSPATWSDGDWNCDGVFNSSDLVAAFARGLYQS